MMEKKNNMKKALSAVGAVVAAGLTPGIIAATPGCLPARNPNAAVTAADVVTIDGNAYSFDELYAQQQPDSAEMNVIKLDIVLEDDPDQILQEVVVSSMYGVPRKPINPHEKNYEVLKGDTVYRRVEQMPQFPGSETALMKYIKSHIKYPTTTAENNVQGSVIVQFVVDKIGDVSEVKVIRSMGEDFDKEAVRVIRSLPKFTPGRHNGQAVSVWCTQSVTFTLPQEKKD